MKISVIVPVYKVEKYIEKCIQSLLDQTYTNFEALIVDDGSPDQSIAIAKKLIGNDSRFIFLEKENGGLSSARNMGLDYATGDYVAFLDSDDYFDSQCFFECINILKDNDECDVLVFGLNWVSSTYKIIKSAFPNVNRYYELNDFLLEQRSLDPVVWNKIYKKEIFNDLRFTEGILYEDKEIMCKILYQKKILGLNKALYYYLQRQGSIMHSYNKNSLPSRFYIAESHKNFMIQEGIYDNNIAYYKKFYIRCCILQTALYCAKYSPNYVKDSKDIINKAKQKIRIRDIFKSYSVVNPRLFAVLFFLFSPNVFKFFYKYFQER